MENIKFAQSKSTMPGFILFFALFSLTSGVKLLCPHNVPYFSTASCTPNAGPFGQSQCPNGYRCRPAKDESDPSTLYYICCDTTGMTVNDYFLETELSPRAVPQIPLSILKSVVLVDQSSGQRVVVDEFDGEVSGADRVINDTASYDRLDFIQFERTMNPMGGQFLHFLVAKGVLHRPTQIQVYYDYPNFGSESMNLTMLEQRLRRGFIQLTTNETVAQSEFYRELVVVLAFSTSQPLGASRDSETQLNKVLEATNGELGQLLSHESFGSKLGAPVGGFFFHLTARSTVFNTHYGGQNPLTSSDSITETTSPFMCILTIILLANKILS